MQLTTRQRIALSNCSKFSSLQFAVARSMDQEYWTTVLHGDNDQFWVPATPREASILIALGYEELPRAVLAQVA
jgi:precorrin-6B methylase 1